MLPARKHLESLWQARVKGMRTMDELAETASFGTLLRKYRQRAGLTQTALAERAGLSRRGIADLERGVRKAPYLRTIRQLADALRLLDAERDTLAATVPRLGTSFASRQLEGAQQKQRLPMALTSWKRASQLSVLGAHDEFPPPRSLDAVPDNLPLQVSSFVGRQRELAEIARLLAANRLVTLTGAGGCGKTRLALQAATDTVDAYPDGVWFVDLAAVADQQLVPTAVLAAMGIREEHGRSAMDALAEFLRHRQTLLVVDNCEHLLDACARLADTLVHACPQLRLLVTSRETLSIGGEAAWRVPSLALPASNQTPATEELAEYDALRLFAERARLVRADFALTDDNALQVLDVCRRLGGIPLAIELAAARVRALSVGQIAERLDDQFRLLTGGSRTALRRHQTLQALVDWSHDLLTNAERVLLRRLSVFAGGCTLEAAESVGAAQPISRADVLDLMTGLVDKSLVVAEDSGAGTRYRLFETIRQYAAQKLLDAEEAADARDQHLAWCLELTKDAERGLHGPQRRSWLVRLDGDQDNLRSALAWSIGSPGRCRGGTAAGGQPHLLLALPRESGRGP